MTEQNSGTSAGAPRHSLADSLRARAALLRTVRRFFDDAGLIEVQPPCLSRDLIIDAAIDPIQVDGRQLRLPADLAADRYYLQSSPELAMKRLLAHGSGSIYSLGPVFRAGERGPQHNVEFTMLEWYEVGAPVDAVIQRTIDLVTAVLGIAPPRITSYRQLFTRTLGLDPIDCPLAALLERIAAVDRALAHRLSGAADASCRDELLDVLMTEAIGPQIAEENLVVRNYPLSQAALAQPCPQDPQTAQRFELFVAGVELANGYGELLDAAQWARREAANNARRRRTGRATLQARGTLAAAMASGLPPCSGVALGFDRLLMLQLGAEDISAAIPLTIETA